MIEQRDIIERLKRVANAGDLPPKGHPSLAAEAAAEIARLRAENAAVVSENDDLQHDILRHVAIVTDTAVEITRLRAEIERKDAALRPFAAVADDFDADGRDLRDEDGIYANLAGDFRRAREALTAGQ